MPIFRGALLAVLATIALLVGFGSATAAQACSASAHLAETMNDHRDCCGGSDATHCVPASCMIVYQAVPPAATVGPPGSAPSQASYWSKVEPLSYDNSGPEPPPPRRA